MVKKVRRWQKGKISGSRVAVVRVNGKKYQIICEANKKWDKELEKKAGENGEILGDCWRAIQSDEERDTAFSVVKIDKSLGKGSRDSKEYEYFILMDGKRAGRYPKTGGKLAWGIKNCIPFLESMEARVEASAILVDNDAPLEKQAELLATHVETLKNDPNCRSVHVLGHSKCGTMNIAMLKYLTDANLDKLNVISYSAPYKGTIFATPKAFEERLGARVKKAIERGQEQKIARIIQSIRKSEPNCQGIVAEGVYNFLLSIYIKIFSNGHMDLDIAEGKEGIYPEQLARYDENYLGKMFEGETLEKLRRIKFTNITTFLTQNTLLNACKDFNKLAGIQCFFHELIFAPQKSDGTVGLESASYIERVCKQNGINISTMRVADGHHELPTDSRILGRIFKELIIGERQKIPSENDDGR